MPMLSCDEALVALAANGKRDYVAACTVALLLRIVGIFARFVESPANTLVIV
jgi:hypothetical protein